jgi:hypothetical protein
LELAALPGSSGLARRFVAQVLEQWQMHGRLNDALLVATELVENALRHTDGGCQLKLHREARAVVIVVIDSSPDMPQLINPNHVGGRGLHLIQRLTVGWHVQLIAGGGKAVSVTLAGCGVDPSGLTAPTETIAPPPTQTVDGVGCPGRKDGSAAPPDSRVRRDVRG